MRVSQYQFDNIHKQMEKEYGKIRKGEEEGHAVVLFPMEGNLLKVYRANPKSNGRRLLEALSLALFQVKSCLTDEEYDLEPFRSEDNERLVHALLMAFDPFTNQEIKEVLEQDGRLDLGDEQALKEYYKEPVICLLRIRESAEIWGRRMGPDGYFKFIESTMGSAVPQNEELNFSVPLPQEDEETS